MCVCVKSQSDRFELKTRESVCVCLCVGVFKHQKVCVHVFPVNVCVDRANPPSATGWAARHTTTIHTNIFVTVGVQKARRAAAQQKASAPPALQSAQQTHASKAPVYPPNTKNHSLSLLRVIPAERKHNVSHRFGQTGSGLKSCKHIC